MENLPGNISNYIVGWNKGDCIGPILFVLCGQIFCINLRANSKIKPITVHSIKCLLKQFCDDMCITIKADYDSLLELERSFDTIAAQSGLKINYSKTEILRIGSLRNTDFKIMMSQE